MNFFMGFIDTLQSSIKSKMIVFTLVPLFLLGFLSVDHNFDVLGNLAKKYLSSTASIKRAALDDYIGQTNRLADSIKASDAVRTYVESGFARGYQPEARDFVATIQEQFWGHYHHIFLTNTEGDVLFSPSPPADSNHLGQNVVEDSEFEEKYFQNALDETQVTPFFGFTESDHYHSLYMTPFKDENGRTLALLVFELEINHIESILNKAFEYGETGEIHLATPRGERVVRETDRKITTFNEEMIDRAGEDGSAAGLYTSDGVKTLGIFLEDPDYPWITVLEIHASEVFASAWNIATYFIIGMVVFGGIALLIGTWWSVGMAATLEKLSDQARHLAEGNFAALSPLALNQNDEMGRMADNFDRMLDTFQEFVESIKQSVEQIHDVSETVEDSTENARMISEQVDEAATQLNQTSDDLSSEAQQASSSLEETSASIEEVSSMIQESADNARSGDELSKKASEAANQGREVVEDMAETMESINEDSERIAEAIEMIDDIAFQTNLLALNAAVEAANAGEQGAGFAVVADEVRELAQRSSNVAEEITEIINESVERTEDGTKKAEESREAFERINEMVNDVSDRMSEVAHAVEEQSKGIEEVNRSMTELENVTEETTRNAEETAESSDELSSQSRQLRDTMDRLEQGSTALEDTVSQLESIIDQFQVEES
jgi:methyl-accepting chemotaxis protein